MNTNLTQDSTCGSCFFAERDFESSKTASCHLNPPSQNGRPEITVDDKACSGYLPNDLVK